MKKYFKAGQSHSWRVGNKEVPEVLQITEEDDDNKIMALSYKKFSIKGVQFHPENVLTKYGKKIIGNFINS